MTSFNIYAQYALAAPTENQIQNFQPTFLYIKRCKVTGLLYFGKTVQQDVEKYLGSGKYWTRNYKKYGKENIETLWYCLFTDIFILNEFALKFSEQQNIIESRDWANMVSENGISGQFTEEAREKARITTINRRTGVKLSEGTILKIKQNRSPGNHHFRGMKKKVRKDKGRKLNDEQRLLISIAKKNSKYRHPEKIIEKVERNKREKFISRSLTYFGFTTVDDALLFFKTITIKNVRSKKEFSEISLKTPNKIVSDGLRLRNLYFWISEL